MLTRYFAVKVLLPELSPVTRNVALTCPPTLAAGLPKASARVSAAATVVAPDIAKPMTQVLFALLLDSAVVRVTSAVPEDDTVTVAAGPDVVRSA